MSPWRERGIAGVREELSKLREEVASLHRLLAEAEERLTRLEVKEELWQAPEAAGDGPLVE